jgi:hypothetical protein
MSIIAPFKKNKIETHHQMAKDLLHQVTGIIDLFEKSIEKLKKLCC